MNETELITALEKATGASLNEESIKGMINEALTEHLKKVPAAMVTAGEAPPDANAKPKSKTPFKDYLMDVRQASLTPAHQKYVPDMAKYTSAKLVMPENATPEIVELYKAMYTSTNTAGGHLVPTEESRELIDLVDQFSAIRPLCREIPMTTNTITFPTLTSGLTAYWIPEAAANYDLTDQSGFTQSHGFKPESDLVLGELTVTNHVLAIKVVVSNQLLEDSNPAIDSILMGLFAETLAAYFDVAILRGTAAATDPVSGLVTQIATNLLATGPVFDYDDIKDLVHAVRTNDPNAPRIDIVAHADAIHALEKIQDNQGRYLGDIMWNHPTEGENVARVNGQPITIDNNILTNLGTGADETRIFAGDFIRRAFIGNRAGMIIKTNAMANPYWTHNQTAFLAEVRLGFNLVDEASFASLNGVPTS